MFSHHRECAQELYQQLTRDLTQGQLLQLSPGQSFTQHASFVLLKGTLVVKGQTGGKCLVNKLSNFTCM